MNAITVGAMLLRRYLSRKTGLSKFGQPRYVFSDYFIKEGLPGLSYERLPSRRSFATKAKRQKQPCFFPLPYRALMRSVASSTIFLPSSTIRSAPLSTSVAALSNTLRSPFSVPAPAPPLRSVLLLPGSP